MVNAEYRVRVNWLDDGVFYDQAIPVGTPGNLVISSPYYGAMNPRVFNSSNVEQTGRITDTLGQSPYGHLEQTIELNATTERAIIGITPRKMAKDTWMEQNILRDDRFFPAYAPHAGISVPLHERQDKSLSFATTVYSGTFGIASIQDLQFYFNATPSTLTGLGVVSFWARSLNPEATTFTATVYDNAGSKGSTSFSPTETWTRYSFTMSSNIATFPYVMRFNRTAGTGTIGTLEFAGFMISDSPLTDYNDGAGITINETTMVMRPDVDYVFSFWAKGSGATDFYIRYTDDGGFTEYLSTVNTVTLTGSYQRVNIPLTAAGRTNGTTKNQVASIVVTNTSNDVTLTGYMQVEGTDITSYHAGSNISAYDNITAYVVNIDWKTGRKRFDEYLAYEGELNLTLNNASRIFSPGFEGSPLFGNLRQNLRVLLELKVGGVWYNIYTGWISSWEIDAGTSSDMRVIIHCKQGLFRLREGDFSGVVENSAVYGHDIVRDLIQRSGYRMVLSPFGALVGVATIGEAAVLTDEDAIFSQYQNSIYPVSFVGEDWSRKTNLEDAIKSLLDAEQSHLWVDRNGGLNLVNRHHWINRTADMSFAADTQSQEATYEYGTDVKNRVEIFLKPKSTIKNQTIWNTRSAVPVRPKREVAQRMNFEHEEGKPRTITHVYVKKEEMTITAYYTGRNRFVDPSVQLTTQEVDKYIDVRVVEDGNSNYTLIIYNGLDVEVYVDVTVNGDYLEGGNGVSYQFEDTENIPLTNAIHAEKLEITFFEEERQAEGYAKYLFLRDAKPKGVFKRIRVTGNPDLVRQIQQGTILSISETQTDEAAVLHVVVGENGEISADGSITVEYELGWIDPTHYIQVGDTIPEDTYPDLWKTSEPRDQDSAKLLPLELIPYKTEHGDYAWFRPFGETARLGLEFQRYQDIVPEIEDIIIPANHYGYAKRVNDVANFLSTIYGVNNMPRLVKDITHKGLIVVSGRNNVAGNGTVVFAFRGKGQATNGYGGRLILGKTGWTHHYSWYWGDVWSRSAAALKDTDMRVYRTKTGQTLAAEDQGLRVTGNSNTAGVLKPVPYPFMTAVTPNGGGVSDGFSGTGWQNNTAASTGESYGFTVAINADENTEMQAFFGALRRFDYRYLVSDQSAATRNLVLWVQVPPGTPAYTLHVSVEDGTGILFDDDYTVDDVPQRIVIPVNSAIVDDLYCDLSTTGLGQFLYGMYILGFGLIEGSGVPDTFAQLRPVTNNTQIYL